MGVGEGLFSGRDSQMEPSRHITTGEKLILSYVRKSDLSFLDSRKEKYWLY